MTDDRAVSVVLPVHNGRPYLLEAVESVAGQTQLPQELVIVDDGSTDGGVEEVTARSWPFPVMTVRQDNAGQSAARNRGVEIATGAALAFIDQDDRWYPDHLEALVARLDDPLVGWVYSDFDEIDSATRVVTIAFLRERGIEHPKRSLASCVAADLMVVPSASVLRRAAFDAVGGFDTELHGYEDDDLYVRVFRSGWRMVFVRRPLTQFRVHQGSASVARTFADSRMRFSRKLRDTIEDDRRLNRYWFRDLVAPRFFAASIDDYMRAVSDRDWGEAAAAYAAVEHFARQHRDPPAAWKLRLLRNPRLFRELLWLNQAMPRGLRPTTNPVFRLR